MLIEGIFEKINRLQQGIDEINAKIATLSNDNQSNFEILEKNITSNLESIIRDLKDQILSSAQNKQ
jgi:flagellar biosynthesis/type III secretory pathway chaperone